MNRITALIIWCLIIVLVFTVGCRQRNEARKEEDFINPNGEIISTQDSEKELEENATQHPISSPVTPESPGQKQTLDESNIATTLFNNEKEYKEVILALNKDIKKAEQSLNSEYKIHPRWFIKGEILSLQDDNSIIIWGTALGGEPNHIGWQLNNGNIQILNPEDGNITIGQYIGDFHWYQGQTQGYNKLGKLVAVKIYGPPPPSVLEKQKELNNKAYQLSETVNNFLSLIDDLAAQKATTIPIGYKKRGDIYYETGVFLHENLKSDYGLINKALDNYTLFVETNPELDILFLVTSIHLSNNDLENAFIALQKVVSIDYKSVLGKFNTKESLYLAGLALYENSNIIESISLLSQSINFGYDSSNALDYAALSTLSAAYLRMGETKYSQNKYGESVDYLKKGIGNISKFNHFNDDTIYDVQGEMNVLLVKNFLELNDLDSAHKILEKVIRTSSDILNNLYIEIAIKLIEDNSFKLGYEYFNKAVYLNYYELSHFEAKAGEYYYGKNSPKYKGYEIKSNSAEVFYIMGLVYLNQGYPFQIKLALPYLEKAIQFNRQNAKYYNALGYYYSVYQWGRESVDDLNTAVDHFKKSVEIDPGYKKPYGNLYSTYKRLEVLLHKYDGDYDIFWQKSLDSQGFSQTGVETENEL